MKVKDIINFENDVKMEIEDYGKYSSYPPFVKFIIKSSNLRKEVYEFTDIDSFGKFLESEVKIKDLYCIKGE